jgi:hypothetical protein
MSKADIAICKQFYGAWDVSISSIGREVVIALCSCQGHYVHVLKQEFFKVLGVEKSIGHVNTYNAWRARLSDLLVGMIYFLL